MFSKAFTKPTTANWIIRGANFAWFLGCFLLLRWYGIKVEFALADSLLFALTFFAGVSVLDRIFGFYIPKGGSNWLLLLLPLVLSVFGIALHFCSLTFFFENPEFLEFQESILPVRWIILWITFTLVTLIALVVAKLELQEEFQSREIMMKDLSKEAELAQLRQQLQPHFLFNSLNSISALVMSKPEKAREMVIQLSDFLRGTIRKDSKDLISLQDELAYLRLYLEIEKVRFGHRLEVEFNIVEESQNLLVPQLLIQPLLENAIKHGLYGVMDTVKILFESSVESGYLKVKIENPFDPKHAAPTGEGFGLSSVERRLFLLYGRKDLLGTEKINKTFRVILKIPQAK